MTTTSANPPDFSFNEDKNQVYYHDMKLFIFGADVTPYLTSQVTLTRNDRDGTNLLSFSLSNAYRCFEMTDENLGTPKSTPDTVLNSRNQFVRQVNGRQVTSNQFRLTDPYGIDGGYSELAKATIFKLKTREDINTLHQVQSFGPNVNSKKNRKLTPVDSTVNAEQTTDDVTVRYPMSLGSLVFHKYDPVRFFVKNPLSRSNNEWTCEFTGFIDTKPFSQDYVQGASTINITCQDIRLLMQAMRVNVNPMATVANQNTLFFGYNPIQKLKSAAVPDTADVGMFNDLFKSGSKLSHVLGSQTFEESIKNLMLGINQNNARVGPVGKMLEGITCKFNPGDNNVLEDWTNLVNFGAYPFPSETDNQPLQPEGAETDTDGNEITVDESGVPVTKSSAALSGDLAPLRRFMTYAEMLNMGRGTYSQGASDPIAQRVHFLFPGDEAPLNNMVAYSMVDARIEARVEFSSRLELLNQVCKGIDYQFYITGVGDMVFEFPMYDFLPSDFNAKYQGIYEFDGHLINDNINDEGGQPISGLVVTSRRLIDEHAQGNPDSESESSTGVSTTSESRVTIFSNVLASRIGPHIETHSLPGITDQNRLAQYGYIEFNKRLSNYNQFSMVPSYRPFITVNRPIYNKVKGRIGITKSCTYTWRIRQDVALDLDLLYTRKIEGDKFRFITGGQSQPISYRTVYGGVKVPKQGVNHAPANNETDGTNSQSAEQANRPTTDKKASGLANPE